MNHIESIKPRRVEVRHYLKEFSFSEFGLKVWFVLERRTQLRACSKWPTVNTREVSGVCHITGERGARGRFLNFASGPLGQRGLAI